MKTVVTLAGTILAALLAISTAHAENSVVAEKVTRGGLIIMPPYGVRIDKTGSVFGFVDENKTPLAQLLPPALEGLASDINDTAGDLVDLDPTAPRCADVPVTDYNVTKSDGTLVTVYRLASCHTYAMSGGEQIKNLLDAFSQLNKAPQHPICPVIDCAAPPNGCHYGPAPLDANGCQLGCGVLECHHRGVSSK